MIRFLDKEKELHLLEQLFDLLYENMRTIAPSDLPYEEEKQQWLSQVGPAMAKAPRQIVLIYDKERLAGYLQYYIRNNLFMVEEIQLRQDCRSTSLFAALWKFMIRIIPEDIHFIEAYADPRNQASRRMMEKLGMKIVEESSDAHFLHFRSSLNQNLLLSCFRTGK